MINQQKQLVESLHRSIQHIVSIKRLIKSPPPSLQALSILDYAQLIQRLLRDLYSNIPKLCVPMVLFKKVEKENQECSELLEQCLQEHRRVKSQLDALQQRVKQHQQRERYLKQSMQQAMKNNHYYKKKAQSLKKSGEQSIKNMLEVVSKQEAQEGKGSWSLPRLDKKQRLSLLWLIGPNINSQRLANHLIGKN